MNRSHLSGGPFHCCGDGGGGGGGTSSTTTILGSRAESLTGSSGLSIFEDDFVVVPGTRGSVWRDMHAVDVHILNNVPGGVVQVASQTGYGSIVVDPFDGYPGIPSNGPSFLGIVDAANPFYMAVRFMLPSDPGTGGPGGWEEAHCSFVIGLVDPNNLKVIGIGCDVGDANFGAINGHVASLNQLGSLESDVPRDLDVWHWAELYTTPATEKWWLKIDDGVPLDVTALFPDGAVLATPFVQIMTADVLQPAVNIDRILYATKDIDATVLPALGSSATLPDGATDVGLALLRAEDAEAARNAILSPLGADLTAAATAAAMRTLLGLLDLTDERSAELAHANAVCAFANPSKLWEADCVTKVGTQGSKWHLLTGGAGALLSPTSAAGLAYQGETGGPNFLTTGGTGTVNLISIPNGLLHYGVSLIPDLNAAASKWHVQFDMKITTAFDATSDASQGWIDPDGNELFMMGAKGSVSTTKFGLFKNVNALSTVNIDTAWHRFRFWADGVTPGTAYFSVDGETPIPLVGFTWTHGACPYVQLAQSGATAQIAGFRQCYYRVDGDLAA